MDEDVIRALEDYKVAHNKWLTYRHQDRSNQNGQTAFYIRIEYKLNTTLPCDIHTRRF